jgi:hypothetical protein
MKEFYYACFKLALSIANKADCDQTPEECDFVEHLNNKKDLIFSLIEANKIN